MNVMLLAAGEGTRLRPYTLTLPKPAIPFMNVPLAGHSLRFLGDLKIDNLVVNTYHLPERIQGLFHRLSHGAKSLHFSNEVGQILGSGGGLGKARKHFRGGGDFIMMNADEVILPADLKIVEKALARHKESKAIATLMVMNHHEVGTKFGGVWADSQNKVKTFGKDRPSTGEKGWHFVGVQILSEKVFDFIPPEGESNILYDALKAAMAQGHLVEAFPFECQWFETGNPQDFLAATRTCMDFVFHSGTAERMSLEKSFQQFLSSRPQIQEYQAARILYSSDASVDPSSQLKGFICLGEGSRIGENCELENVVIGPAVQLPAGTKASNTLFL